MKYVPEGIHPLFEEIEIAATGEYTGLERALLKFLRECLDHRNENSFEDIIYISFHKVRFLEPEVSKTRQVSDVY